VLEFHAKAPQATASEELTQGPYVAARAEFEPTTTLRTKGFESTNEPPCQTIRVLYVCLDDWMTHVLRHYLIDKPVPSCSLQARAHNFVLPPKDDRNFVSRALCKAPQTASA